MTCYAIGHLREIEMGPDIVAYLEGIDATLAPLTAASSSMEARNFSWKARSRGPHRDCVS